MYYILQTSHLIYHIEKNRKNNSAYNKIILCNNFINKINVIYMDIRLIIQKIKDTLKKGEVLTIYRLTKEYDNNMLILNTTNTYTTRKCKCLCEKFMVDTSNNIICKVCNTIQERKTFVDKSNQVKNKIRSTGYDIVRQFKNWINRAQARYNFDIDPEVLNNLRTIIHNNKLENTFIRCDQIRVYLKEIKHTELNNHIPLIRKKITGIEPASINSCEMNIIYRTFNKVITAYNKIKPPHKSSIINYQYCLYKLVDHIVEDIPRKKKILECLHLQNERTLIEIDRIWRSICKEVKDLTYKPTNRYEYYYNI